MEAPYSVLMHYRDWEFHFATDLKRNEQFQRHIDTDGMIRLLYKYNHSSDFGQTEIIFMLPDDNGKLKRTLVKRYGVMSPFARWWEDLTHKDEEKQYHLANII
jgi:hypothetical protein